jgi:hypothetical protein
VQLTEFTRKIKGETSSADFVVFCQKNVDFQQKNGAFPRVSSRPERMDHVHLVIVAEAMRHVGPRFR